MSNHTADAILIGGFVLFIIAPFLLWGGVALWTAWPVLRIVVPAAIVIGAFTGSFVLLPLAIPIVAYASRSLWAPRVVRFVIGTWRERTGAGN